MDVTDVILVMFKSDGTRKEFSLSGTRMKIGRTRRCDLRVPLSSVSREHCEIVMEDRGVVIRDLGSSNGTFHNRKRIQESPLTAGDEITIGPVVFTVVIDGQPVNLLPAPTKVSDPTALGETLHYEQPRELMLDDDDNAPIDAKEEVYSPTMDLDDLDEMTGMRIDEVRDDSADPSDSNFQSDRSGVRNPEPV